MLWDCQNTQIQLRTRGGRISLHAGYSPSVDRLSSRKGHPQSRRSKSASADHSTAGRYPARKLERFKALPIGGQAMLKNPTLDKLNELGLTGMARAMQQQSELQDVQSM